MGNYPPAYLYRKISQVTSFVSSMGALRAPSGDTLPPKAACPHTPLSTEEEAQSHKPQEVQEVVEEVIQTVEEVQEVVEEVIQTVEEVQEVVEEVIQTVEEVQAVVEEVKEVVEEVTHVVEEVTHVVEEVTHVVEEVTHVVEEVQEVVEVKEDIERVQEEIKEDIERVQEVRVEDVQDVMMEEAPEALQVVHESFMPPAFHFPTSPFSMSLSMSSPIDAPPTNRLRYRKRRG